VKYKFWVNKIVWYTSQSVGQSVSQPVSQPASQTVSQSSSQSSSQSASRPVSQPVSQPASQSASQSVSQSVGRSVGLLYNFSNCCLYSSLRIYSFPDCAIFHGKNAMYCCLQMYVQLLSLVSEVTADCWIMSAACTRKEFSENLCDKFIFLTKEVLSKWSHKFWYIISFTTGTVTLKYLQHYRQKFRLPCVVKPSVLGCALYC